MSYNNSNKDLIAFPGIKGQQLSITPSGIVDVTENSRFTITCSYTGPSTYNIVTWVKDGRDNVYGLLASNCSPFAGTIDPNAVEFTCTNNGRDFSLTFAEVKKEQDGERWSCKVDTGPETISAEVTIKIKGGVISI